MFDSICLHLYFVVLIVLFVKGLFRFGTNITRNDNPNRWLYDRIENWATMQNPKSFQINGPAQTKPRYLHLRRVHF